MSNTKNNKLWPGLALGLLALLAVAGWWRQVEPNPANEFAIEAVNPGSDASELSAAPPDDDKSSIPVRQAPVDSEIPVEPNGQPATRAATATHEASLPAELPRPIRQLLEFPHRRPTAAALQALKPSDAEVLLLAYRNEPELTNRMAAAFGLAMTGDERALEAFKRTMSSEFAGKTLNDAELRTMVWHMDAIGLLARKSDAALAFLTSCMSVSGWQNSVRREWLFSSDPVGWKDEWFVIEAIRAIGMSGRPEGMKAVLELAQQMPAADPSLIASAIVDAVFFQAYWEEHGLDPSLVASFSKDMAEASLKWSMETEQGKRWFAWFVQIESTRTR